MHHSTATPSGERMPAAATRVRIDVDATVSPKELAAAYSERRQELVGPRHRPLTDKHYRLAVCDADASGTAQRRMEAWNGAHPDWAYTEARDFQRDCQQARERVLFPFDPTPPADLVLRALGLTEEE